MGPDKVPAAYHSLSAIVVATDADHSANQYAFMLVREVSVRADMVNNRFRLGAESSNL